jgi:hypothetical protein
VNAATLMTARTSGYNRSRSLIEPIACATTAALTITTKGKSWDRC